ncbi:MAG TPA: hypothetical protein VMA54_19895, partial [Steroidobacteraceae bacterium]|nr:hypothetical protein [Steroidobacteraceae bacterium]
MTLGTATIAGPEDATKFTADPGATSAPTVGVSLMILPDAMLVLDCWVTAPTVRPAPVMVLDAAACMSPTTFGTTSKAMPVTAQDRLAGLNATV